MNVQVEISDLLMVGYVACFIFCNFIAYLISTFYQKKIHQHAVRSGFLLSIIGSVIFIPLVFFQVKNEEYTTIIQNLLLLTASGLSLWNSINLYLTMKKVQK